MSTSEPTDKLTLVNYSFYISLREALPIGNFEKLLQTGLPVNFRVAEMAPGVHCAKISAGSVIFSS